MEALWCETLPCVTGEHSLNAFCRMLTSDKNAAKSSGTNDNEYLNTLRPKQNGRHFTDDIFTCIFLNENVWIPIEISPKFVPQGPINNIPALVQIMAWRRSADKPLSEPLMIILLTHICITRPQWVNSSLPGWWKQPCWWWIEEYFHKWKHLNLERM